MPCFNLISCNPGLYPSILSLCWKGTHPYDGMVVYITGQSPLETYTLTFIGGGCVCTGTVPDLRPTTQNSCTPTYDIFKYRNCETGAERNFGFPLAPAPGTFKIPGDCECWTFVGEEAIADELATTFDSYADCEECLNARAEDICPAAERTLSYAIRVQLPDSPPPNRNFSKCCYLNLVLADISDTDPYKNDFTGSWFKSLLNQELARADPEAQHIHVVPQAARQFLDTNP